MQYLYKFIFSPDVLPALAGLVLSMFFAYFPKVKYWWSNRTGEVKRLLMGGLIVLVSLAIFGLNCSGLIVAEGLTCNQAGGYFLARTLFVMLIVNQGVYNILPNVYRGGA